MIRMTFLLLAGAALPAGLCAQTVSPPVAWEDTPQVRLNVPAMPAPRAMPVRAPAAAVAPRPAAAVVPQPLPPAARPAPQSMPAARVMPVAARPVPMRGQRIDARWRDPRFGVPNYGAYGLYPPATGSRWVRHYDDALLIDDGDIVRDSRSGLDWDEYGDWDEEDGVPVYVGRGEYAPDDEDYAYVEDYAEGVDRAYANNERYERQGPGYPGERVHTTRYVVPADGAYHPCPPHAHADPCDCGHYPPGTVITETIVKRPPVVKSHVYYVEQPVAAPVKVKRIYRNRVKPAPIPYGEKG